MTKQFKPIWVYIFVLLAGCSTVARQYHWQDVSRVVEPEANSHIPHGSLVVYTEREEVGTWTEDRYHPYSPYTVYSEDGKKVKYVDNRTSDQDENPERIQLPPGKYIVVPKTHLTKQEIVGAIIQDGKLTEVQLKDI